jgi:hypothetical protein
MGDELLEGLTALQAFVPLAFHPDSDSLSLRRGVHEDLVLDAMPLQRRIGKAASDTDGRSDRVLSRDEQIIGFLAGGKGIPAFQVQQVGQATNVAKPDFSVPVTGGLDGYC